MDPIRSFCGKLRAVARTLDCEAARLQRALEGEDSDFEEYPMRILHDLHSDVQTLKDDVSILLSKTSLENQENICFLKTVKVLMKKNSADIMKIQEYFQKYGYEPRVKKNSVCEQDGVDCAAELAQQPEDRGAPTEPPSPDTSISEKPARSPQLSDFGLERYMIPHALPKPAAAESQHQEEPQATPAARQSAVTVPKTPRCALRMDDFECVTPKLEHFGISEYTMCLNEDYTVGLKNIKNSKREETIETGRTGGDLATPEPIIQQPKNCDAGYADSPVVPTFCTPGLKIPMRNSTTLMSTNHPTSKANSSSHEVQVTDCGPLVLKSDECFENFSDPSPATISSYENFLRSPTPPEVTTIPEDMFQILTKYNSKLATPIAIKPMPGKKEFLRYEGRNFRDVGNKENW
ncbi:spindle and kinetochore-associated protein 3 [Ochotona princeps]|uniref:spindle and kinetochore-associated protein 3 n=1 Tax=Ochotona princeps TaxID=9978 RepID=UPI002715298D|nr:spindle and kinetochore-associated protein 3 [Ochotona princeps]